MARYSVREGRWHGVRYERASGPDPYGPDAPGRAERNRETSTVLRNGIVRVDIGAPVVRLPGEGKRQPAKTAAPPAEPAPPEPSVEPEAPFPAPAKSSPLLPYSSREPWGLNRDGR